MQVWTSTFLNPLFSAFDCIHLKEIERRQENSRSQYRSLNINTMALNLQFYLVLACSFSWVLVDCRNRECDATWISRLNKKFKGLLMIFVHEITWDKIIHSSLHFIIAGRIRQNSAKFGRTTTRIARQCLYLEPTIMSASYTSGCSIEVRMHGGGSPEDSAAQISAQPAPVMPIVCLQSTYREPLRRWSNFNSQARRRNKGRGIAVTMRRCTYLSLITQPCAYCGARPLPGQFVGVDRLRSDGIYSPENSVPCCKVCNFMKGSLSVPQFFSHLKAIAAHQKLNMD